MAFIKKNQKDILEEHPCNPKDENLCSFLLAYSPVQLTTFAFILYIILANELTYEEQSVVGNFFSLLGQSLQLSSAQGELFKQVDERIDEIKKEKEEKNKPDPLEEIDKLKKEIDELKSILDNQLKL